MYEPCDDESIGDRSENSLSWGDACCRITPIGQLLLNTLRGCLGASETIAKLRDSAISSYGHLTSRCKRSILLSLAVSKKWLPHDGLGINEFYLEKLDRDDDEYSQRRHVVG